MNSLTLGKSTLPARPLHGKVSLRSQVHLDARQGGVVQRFVAPVGQAQVAADQAVDVRQQVAVECGSHPKGVVVSGLQLNTVFNQINADEQSAAIKGAAGFMGLAQEAQRLGGGEVADAGAGVKQQARCCVRGTHLRRQVQCVRKIQAHAYHVERRILVLQTGQCGTQELHRNVHGDVTPRCEAIKQTGGLVAVARSEVDQRGTRGHVLGHGGAMRPKNAGFGAGGVVLGQLGDGLEQARPQCVVQKLGRCAGATRLRVGAQALQQLLAHCLQLHGVNLNELGRFHGQSSGRRIST